MFLDGVSSVPIREIRGSIPLVAAKGRAKTWWFKIPHRPEKKAHRL